MTTFHSKEAMQVTNVTLNIKDLNKMNHFYSEILGFLLKETDTQTIFNVGEHGHTLTLHLLDHGRHPEFRSWPFSYRLFIAFTTRFS